MTAPNPRPPIALIFTLFAMLLPPPSSNAGWREDGSEVCVKDAHQFLIDVVSDGSGGSYLVWRDERWGPSDFDIYAQRMDRFGNPIWTLDGIPACFASGNQDTPQIVSDGAGGAIVAWVDLRSGNNDIYAQRLDGSGNELWTSNGNPVCSETSSQILTEIIPDGSGGAIIAWVDYRSDASGDVYVQRLDASGSPLWTVNGLAAGVAAGAQLFGELASDGLGGAIIAWQDERSGTEDVYAQRVNAGGASLWGAGGTAICTAVNEQVLPNILEDGFGGAFITWSDGRAGNRDVYAQNVSSIGLPRWTTDGFVIANGSGSQRGPQIVSDGVDGAIIVWNDTRNGDNDIYGQRVHRPGTIAWDDNGKALVTGVGVQSAGSVIADGAGGTVVAYHDDVIGPNDLLAHHFDPDGKTFWSSSVLISNEAPSTPHMASTGPDAAVISWYELTNGEADVHAQRIETDYGYWGHPEPVIESVSDVPGDQGGAVSLNWTASGRDILNQFLIQDYSIWRSTTAGAAKHSGALIVEDLADLPSDLDGPIFRVDRKKAGDYYWEWIGSQTAYQFAGYSFAADTRNDSTSVDLGMHYFQVLAHTSSQFLSFTSNPDSGYSADNLAPAAPFNLYGARQGSDVELSWKKPVDNAGDLDHYRVYRDTQTGLSPVPGLLVGTATDTTFLDAGAGPSTVYYYLVTAVDVHENEGDPSTETEVGAVTGVPNAPGLFQLSRNVPNPFNPTTKIRYSVPDETFPVVLRIFDPAGRIVRTLSSGEQPARTGELIWDGTNDSGSPVGSGVYMYRLEWGGRSETRRMTLVR